jgi:hypothetical protein
MNIFSSIVPLNDSIPLSSDQIKLEPQLHTDDNIQHPNDSINDYDLAEKVLFNFSDITPMSNGPEQLISSETVDHNLGVLNNNESPFDTL